MASLLVALFVAGCAAVPVESGSRASQGPQPRAFTMQRLFKSDIHGVIEVHQRATMADLQTLADKLYRRNPRELRKSDGADPPDRQRMLARLFAPQRPEFAELHGQRGAAAMDLALDVHYTGDRVLALVVGLRDMLMSAYGNKRAYYLFDHLDPQRLYNSARNLEILVWRLDHRLGADGRPLLLTNSLPGEPGNRSFERLFGRMIGRQDTLTSIVADRTNRTIKKAIQNVATLAFLPV